VQLSPHFTLAEFTRSDYAARHNINNRPLEGTIERLRDTAERLEEVRALLKSPITITSGYRCPALNASVGGSVGSQHVLGLAVDFVAPDFGTPFEVCQAILASGIQFDQLIHEYGEWTHISFVRFNPRRHALTIFTPGRYTPGITQRSG
jgi:hypothetical protein